MKRKASSGKDMLQGCWSLLATLEISTYVVVVVVVVVVVDVMVVGAVVGSPNLEHWHLTDQNQFPKVQ